MSEFNDRIIAEFRANNGRVESAGFGTHLVLVHTVGARSGQPRVNPAMSLRDSDDWLAIASAQRSAKDPAWAVNLRARPDTVIEVAAVEGPRTVPVRATELAGDEYAAAFPRFEKCSSAFTTYQRRAAPRLTPVIRLRPSDTVGASR
jgi:deazaflavin-dependent oxidoreductase (nitroreductase family)